MKSTYHKKWTKTPHPSSEEIKLAVKAHYEKLDKANFAKKKREGYKYWCYTPAFMGKGRMYFRSLKSAQAWARNKQTYPEGVGNDIHEL